MVKKFTIPFASQGDANDIPDALQADGKVSFTQGFGYDYERPYDDPQAKDIAREDMNGLFKAITSAVGELQTLGASEWSSAIAYPKGAIIYHEKDLYISQVDDNQNKPPQNWVSITSIANDSLKKAANLSDLTNKATARNNLGLGSSATLNKTDVLGTSTSLVATQKLVNDTKINLESSKQDKLTFIGSGKVMKEGAYGLGEGGIHLSDGLDFNDPNLYPNRGMSALYSTNNKNGPTSAGTYVISLKGSDDYEGQIGLQHSGRLFSRGKSGSGWGEWREYWTPQATTGTGNIARMSEIFDAVPVGVVKAYIGETAPNDKWLLCRGQAFSAGGYPALAQLLPDLKIPDLRGVALRGLDANRGFDPGRALLSYQEDAMQKITGSFIARRVHAPSDIDIGGYKGAFKDGGDNANYGARKDVTGGPVDGTIAGFDSSLVSRSNSQNETVMKNVAVNFIIKAR